MDRIDGECYLMPKSSDGDSCGRIDGSRAAGQDSWRFCHKCVSMFFDGFPNKGSCPRGGGHEAAGFNFRLPHF